MMPDSSPAQERPLVPQPNDGRIGLLALACIAAAVCYWAGPGGVLRLLCAWMLARVVCWLWQRDAGFGKVICVVAVPAVLLVYCLPKRLGRAVQALPSETDA